MNAIAKIGCRAYQKVFKVVSTTILPWRVPELITGAGSIKKLPEFIASKGIKSVLVVTDNMLMKLGLVPPMLEEMDKINLKYAVYSDVVPNPTIDNIEDALKIYKENNCEAIVAFGGGSPMDCAKIVAARAVCPNKPVSKMKGLLKILKKIPPFFAVPTTSGTGSEATLAAVITDPKTHEKYPINDPSIIPNYAVLDPELTLSLPKHITSTTGMDALTHAVEAYIGHSNTKFTAKESEIAVELIFKYLKRAYDDGSDIEARQKMQEAAYHAGCAFTRAYVGYVHAIAHSIGGKYGVPHGLANAIILPHVLDYFGDSCHAELARLADFAGITGANETEKALNFVQAIKDMNDYMAIPKYVEGKILEEDIPWLANHALKEANPLYPVPKFMGKKEMLEMYQTIQGK
ncbi:MAG: iron-containing alcohol dehydrogenase [Clostridia bacterium]|nr:iron-containing alcohol dehydrogenase [Clostridia bacterium]